MSINLLLFGEIKEEKKKRKKYLKIIYRDKQRNEFSNSDREITC